jgi:hypothetical protein
MAEGNNGRPPPPSPGPGRYKGIPNKIGRQAKDNVVAVFDQVGGVEAMVKWAKRNKTEFYKLYARLIPSYVQAQVNVRAAAELSDAELVDIIEGRGSFRTTCTENGIPIFNEIH